MLDMSSVYGLRDEGRQGGFQGGREQSYPGRPVNAGNGMSSCPTFRDPRLRAQRGQEAAVRVEGHGSPGTKGTRCSCCSSRP